MSDDLTEALVNDSANPITLVLDDSRRLTGKNLFMNQPGAILDAWVSGIDKHQVVTHWLKQVEALLDAVGWAQAQTVVRIFEDGISVGFSAPWDGLYAATTLNEYAWQLACHTLALTQGHTSSTSALQSQELGDIDEIVMALRQAIAQEANPALLALIQAAQQHHVPFLSDDEVFSLGYGRHTQTWPIAQLPDASTLDWPAYQAIPVALVTGTNGKSTSVRLCAHILMQAKINAGVTSTDFIRVGQQVIDKGDYSGPGGARTLLRHPETEAAVLEVARGGLLRRGLPVSTVDVALVTNIAADHLGQYGINNLAALTAAKMMVAKAVSQQLVLNADDEQLVAYVAQCSNRNTHRHPYTQTPNTPTASISHTLPNLPTYIAQNPVPDELPSSISWFALSEHHPVLQQACASQQAVCFVRAGQIIYIDQTGTETTVSSVVALPMTLQGAAVHNIYNALGVVMLCKALGAPMSAIRQGLASFYSNPQDNPGRGNVFTYREATVMLDFAHNVHSMQAMTLTLQNMPAGRRLLLMCLAGDRTDADIKVMTQTALQIQPDLIWVCELPDYLRGRKPGEVSGLIAAAAQARGLPPKALYYADSPLAGARQIIAQIRKNDLVFMMALSQRDQIAALLQE